MGAERANEIRLCVNDACTRGLRRTKRSIIEAAGSSPHEGCSQPAKRKLRPVVQHAMMAKRTRNSLTCSSMNMIERFCCCEVSE